MRSHARTCHGSVKVLQKVCLRDLGKPVLVVTTRFVDEVEAPIARNYQARRNILEIPLTRDELLRASDGADALLITLLERLDSEFFKRAPASIRAIATTRPVLTTTSISWQRRIGKSPLLTHRESTRTPTQTSRCYDGWVRRGVRTKLRKRCVRGRGKPRVQRC
jgi:hypothetical protein